MIIQVRVIPKAKFNRIQELADNSLKIHITQPPENNKANKAVIAILKRYYGLKKNQISIIQGERSQNKLIEINVKR